jgi:hypothetical protein
MNLRFIGGSFLLLAAVGFAAARPAASPALKWAMVNLSDTTLIAGTFVSGPVVFVHDDDRMARGEPCTTVHRYDSQKGIGEEIVGFHCKPRWTSAPGKFTKATRRTPDGPPILTEYQFAGDTEAHGVPTKSR